MSDPVGPVGVTGQIDLNSDVGEGFGAWPGGPDAALLTVITSANVACGFHAGDPSIMRATCAMAVAQRVVIGAQVSYPDLVGFGRRCIDMKPAELTDAVLYQLGALDAMATAAGGRVGYVKPHGALYNAIVHHEAQAAAVVAAIVAYDADLPLLGLPGAVVRAVAEQRGLRFVAEGFADRGYAADGTLLARGTPGALVTDPVSVAAHAVDLAIGGVESICVHSDTPGAVVLVEAVRAALAQRGLALCGFVAR
ncbi:MAG: 5-oxoprolinase subunit PxpA [Ilumatobacteraceae bacterium]